MPSTKEIKNHIKSIKDTQKITNAMYMIASTKLRKAKAELDGTRPYFDSLQREIRRIFWHAGDVESNYFYPDGNEQELPGSYAYLIITADKGLAGAYNQNVIKMALSLMSQHSDPKLFVVGEYGRHYCTAHNIPYEQTFLYTDQSPSIQRARDISQILLTRYNKGEFSKVFVVYTDMKNAITSEARYTRLLPFSRSDFMGYNHEDDPHFSFYPSAQTVLDNILPSCFMGYIYSALIDSYCCEQNARMTAMDSANQNAEKLLAELSVQYNHVRQSTITREITEITAGVRSMKKAKEAK